MVRAVDTRVCALLLGKAEQFVRIGLQQKRLPFGTAVQTGRDRWSYHISARLLADYTGLPQADIEAAQEEAEREKGRAGNDE